MIEHDKPLAFTVVIPTYNRPALALRAVKSALNAMTQADELWLIDDGSTEDYSDVVSFLDRLENANYLRIQNSGVSDARNIGIKRATKSLIALLDDDDEWLPEHLELQRKVYLNHPEVSMIFSDFFNGPDNDLQPGGVNNWSSHKQDLRSALTQHSNAEGLMYFIGDIYREQLVADHVCPSALSFKTERSIMFESKVKRNQSWLFSSTLSKCNTAAFIDRSTTIQHAPVNVARATAISSEKTLLSRLFVISQVWAKDKTFVREEQALFNQWFFNDFYALLRASISARRFSLLKEAYKIIGARRFFQYIAKSAIYILLNRKPIYRNA